MTIMLRNGKNENAIKIGSYQNFCCDNFFSNPLRSKYFYLSNYSSHFTHYRNCAFFEVLLSNFTFELSVALVAFVFKNRQSICSKLY